MKKQIKKSSLLFLSLAILLIAPPSLAQKTSKASNTQKSKGRNVGPRGGQLRSAGTFLTELLIRGSGMSVFLLDNNKKFPTVKKSSIEGQVYVNKKEYNVKFWVNLSEKKFVAHWPTELKPMVRSILRKKSSPPSLKKINQGISVVLLPIRNKVLGVPVIYKINYPDKKPKPKPEVKVEKKKKNSKKNEAKYESRNENRGKK